MNWFDRQTWKNSFISTILCLIGCSVGVMSITYFLANNHWLLILVASFITGLITCTLFILLWNIIFRKMSFKMAFGQSFKMSFTSMSIMIITENIMMLLIHTDHTEAFSHMLLMLIAMVAGFLIVLPYNYYASYKMGKACHQ